eukprot:CAMPEP_0197074780 /NCGR_PEP_ID=MMETSP1384-20130603/211280_1 /TAXON_ID=29189 /ORGANISM="Ammonia sp." /LENGTH=452 /DNA_ID=CAMNT_0042513621 /DNA_START=82 /DNA_END=1440 /DNA_ORIENTATION=+
MGQQIHQCCTQALPNNNDDDELSDDESVVFVNYAKQRVLKSHKSRETATSRSRSPSPSPPPLHPTEAQSIEQLPLGLPRKRSNSACSSKVNAHCCSHGQSKARRASHSRPHRRSKSKPRLHSLEQALDATQMELKHQKEAIQLLKEQNEFLKKQNEEFIQRFGAHFQSAPCSLHAKHVQSTTHAHTHSDDANVSPASRSRSRSSCAISPICTNLSALSESGDDEFKVNLGYASPWSPVTPSSPLQPLSNKETSIILNYCDAKRSFPDTQVGSFVFGQSGDPPMFVDEASGNAHRSRSELQQTMIIHADIARKALSNYDSNDSDVECECNGRVDGCKPVKRLIVALKWYANCDGNYGKLVARIRASTYDKYIVSDYEHVLNEHLFRDESGGLYSEYQSIQNEIHLQMPACDISTCDGYVRCIEKNLAESNEHEFCMDFMDLVHCYLVHLHHVR